MTVDEILESVNQLKKYTNDELEHISESLRYLITQEHKQKELDTLPFLPTLEPKEEFVKKSLEPLKFLGNVNLGTISFDTMQNLK